MASRDMLFGSSQGVQYGGQRLNVSIALSREEMEKMREERSGKLEKEDKRNLYLAKEGGEPPPSLLCILPLSPSLHTPPSLPPSLPPFPLCISPSSDIPQNSEMAKELSKTDLAKRMQVCVCQSTMSTAQH